MAGYLIAEEGPVAGLIVRFEEGNEWILGRDPDVAGIVLEDPMVSRRHVICRLTPEGFLLENLSSVNPATQNGKVITEAVLLREGDILQIGNTFFRFTERNPQPPEDEEEISEISPRLMGEGPDLSSLSFDLGAHARWMLKVISGPNTGAEFGMQKSSSYILGKDPNTCDIVFQDLSVSRQHARLTVDDQENVFIEDLGSRNGVLVNGFAISDKQPLSSQDLIAIGTTSFLIIDREQVRETIISPPSLVSQKTEMAATPSTEGRERKEEVAVKAPRPHWKEMIISTRHLILAGLFGILIIGILSAMFSLFKTEPVIVAEKNEQEQIQEALKNYPDIQFSFNETSGKLFLVGHVLTPVDKQELLYLIKKYPFVESIDDNVVIDEYVWQNMNALLMTNPEWQGVSFHSPVPGRFVLRGYLRTIDQAQLLSDYINLNFPYLDRLDNQVVVENNLMTQIQSVLQKEGFNNVTFQLSNGELVLAGRVDSEHSATYNHMLTEFKGIKGIRTVKNYVVMTNAETSRIDLSSQYQISGYSKKDETAFSVVINGRILSAGDTLDGMAITAVQPNIVLLEKDGLKFRINYNLQ